MNYMEGNYEVSVEKRTTQNGGRKNDIFVASITSDSEWTEKCIKGIGTTINNLLTKINNQTFEQQNPIIILKNDNPENDKIILPFEYLNVDLNVVLTEKLVNNEDACFYVLKYI